MKGPLHSVYWLFVFLFCAGCTRTPERTWYEEEGYRWAVLSVSGTDEAGFRPVDASRAGLDFANTLDEQTMVSNRMLINGSGVAVGDVDGDDLPDIYLARLEGPNVLYKNRGNWRFEDISESAGVSAPDRYSTGALLEDVDGDGDLDLLVTATVGPDALFLNDGTGVFTEATDRSGIDPASAGTSMAMADVDGDGDLDLYIANYKSRSVRDLYHPRDRSFSTITREEDGKLTVLPPFDEHYKIVVQFGQPQTVELATADAFYLNDGNGVFTRTPVTGPVFLDEDGQPVEQAALDWALSARFQDLTGDGAPDLYVCNDFEGPDHFWINQGDGTFRKAPPLALRKTSNSSMSIAVADLDRDGDNDFFVADMLSRIRERRLSQMMSLPPILSDIGDIENRPQETQNTLFLNRGDTTFAEVAWMAGVAASEWTWSSVFMDVDYDGFEDLLLSTGHYHDNLNADVQTRLMQQPPPNAWQQVLLEFPDLKLTNIAYRNSRDGSFEERSDTWGFSGSADVTHGMAAGDFDQDGDLDIVGNRLNEAPLLLENRSGKARIALRLVGLPPNTQGIGARVSLTGGGLTQSKEFIAGGEYLSDSEGLYSFAALGPDMTLTVHWRSGRVSTIANLQENRIYEVLEAQATEAPRPAPEEDETPSFVERSFGHTHYETVYNDFSRQPLLPRRLTEAGPGLAIADTDLDGDDDVIIGSGAGGTLSHYINENGTFAPASTFANTPPVQGDYTGILVLPKPDGTGVHILAGVSNYEFSGLDSSYIQVYDYTQGRLRSTGRLSFDFAAIGALAAGDLDQDGDLDLFAAGRAIAGAYPVPTYSRVYEQVRPGEWIWRADWSEPLEDAGTITAATVGDIDGDTDQDLILATEWGPIQVFENGGNGRLVRASLSGSLSTFTGWWQSVALADVNGDQRLDIVAGNWGWNGQHGDPSATGKSIRTYYGDFDNNQTFDLIETVFEPYHNGYYPNVHFSKLIQHIPSLRAHISSHNRFARTRIENLPGASIDPAAFVEANTLTSMVFLNQGDSFSAQPLPRAAQSFPIFGLVVLDANSDGAEDLYLGGNFHGLPLGEGRIDAGRGLLLHGQGDGSFITARHPGIRVYGEQRAAGHADFDRDGRVDLLVTQNGRETRLFEGQGSAGTRIRLQGPPSNPTGIGALIALMYPDDTRGPVRLVTAGAGYWTQHSAVQVLSSVREMEGIWVRWSDGKVQIVPVSNNQEEVIVPYEVD